ncbi:MAG: ester cyclase [Eudoraea sp.]|nr:ester cyclase [Eudoraea sp.]NNK30768.1 SnoaL-like domain-containing protein [Flavobacteriaceae bacterium]
MKNLFFIAFCAILFIGCQPQGPERFSTTGPEIDLVKALIADYEAGNWEAWNAKFADTVKVYHNNWNTPVSAKAAQENHQQALTQVSEYKFRDEPRFLEKIIDDDGETWVNFWGVWEGTLRSNGEVIQLPVHLTLQIADGKIVEEHGFWDSAITQNALAKITAAQNAPEAIQSIMTNQDKIAEAWSNYDKELFASLSAPNVIRNGNGVRMASNQEEYGAFMDVFHTAFPDFHVTIDNSVIKDGKSYINWTCTGTNTGEFMGNPPTGKKIVTHGVSIWTFDANGIVLQEDAFYDNGELYNQLGYTVSPPEGE